MTDEERGREWSKFAVRSTTDDEIYACIGALLRERDEARAECERLRAIMSETREWDETGYEEAT